MASTEELLVENLRDILDAEKQAVKNMPKMSKAASSQELKDVLQQHLEVTKGQVTRLEQVFELLGQRAKSKPCKAMQGLVEEAIEHIGEHEKGDELDALIIASAQKIEHYEIASYGTARAMAKASGHKDAANLLQETLKEEGDADKLLTKAALDVYREMVRSEGESEEGVEEEARAAGGRGTSSRGSSRGASGSKKKVAAQSGNTSARSNGASRGKSGTRASSDHDEIRQWAEERGAHPACVRGTGAKGDTGLLRLDFPGYSGGESLQEITWDEFFEKFDEQGLALLFQESTAGGQKSNFNKLVARETAALAAEGGRGSGRRGSSGGGKRASRSR